MEFLWYSKDTEYIIASCATCAGEAAASGVAGFVDSAITALGRAAFFPQFAVFPVKYLDSDLAVFTFPPLRDSLIAVQRVQ